MRVKGSETVLSTLRNCALVVVLFFVLFSKL